jgi:hypothetical protein
MDGILRKSPSSVTLDIDDASDVAQSYAQADFFGPNSVVPQ